MKILKQGKKVAPPHPNIVEIINRIVELPQDELPAYLGTVGAWIWPRSDLHSWVKVLNKFDDILKSFIDNYDIDKLQLKPFLPLAKATILEILRFETLLLDNSTNRKLFASYDRINSLLFSNDTDVIVGALQLLLRPSQQYSSQPSVSHTQNVSTKRLASLAIRWSSIKEHGVNVTDILNPQKAVDLPKAASQVTFMYYAKSQPTIVNKNEGSVSQTPTKSKAPSTSVPMTSTPGTSSSQVTPGSNGTVTIHTSSLADSEKRAVDLLAEQLEKHEIPEDDKFDLLCRIRVALSLGSGTEKRKERENAAVIRLLALAVYAHTMPESEAQSAFFIYEPDIISEIAALLQPENCIPIIIQTAAIAALDGFARYRNKTGEVLSATNAGVTHGILMTLVRRLVHDLNDPQSDVTFDFADSLISFIIFLTQNPAGGSMIVGAGLLPLLVQLLQNREPGRLQVVSKITNILDAVLYGYGNGFNSFCNNRGVDVLVSRIEYEVDIGLQDHGVDHPSEGSLYGHLPYPRAVLLKHVMRTMHRMMQASGTTENLRGLIDSSLTKSLKKIMENRGLFGPAIFSIAINIMAAFVHNEPTSLTIIQESGLPDAFYRAIESGLESSTEVITTVPGAIGALCLNQAGLDDLANRPKIIPQIFSIFTSEQHIRTLQEKDNATYIGAGFDELVRHHPSLKKPVFDAVIATFDKIEDIGGSYTIPPSDAASYGLVPEPSEDIDMTGAVDPSGTTSQGDAVTSTNVESVEVNAEKNNLVVTYIDIVGRFLDGLFQHVPHCKEFVTNFEGVERICRLYSLPVLPINFSESNAASSLVSIVRSMAEAVTVPTLERLSQQVRLSMDETKELWNSEQGLPNLGSLADQAKHNFSDANSQFRQLLTLNLRIHLLSQVYSSVGYTHSRSPNSIAQVVSGEDGSKLIRDLGIMYRTFIWEILTLIGPDPYKRLTVSGSQIALASPSPAADAISELPDSASRRAPSTAIGASESAGSTAREQNIKAVKGMIQTLTKSTTPFFQAVTKLFLYNRRTADFVQRRQANTLSKLIVKDVLLEHLKWRGSGTLVPSRVTDDKVILFSYTALVVGLIATLLFDERTSQNSLHTLMLLTMWQVDALDVIVEICNTYISTLNASAKQVSTNPSSGHASEVAAAFVGLEVVLRLFQALVASRPLMDSGQTSMLLTRDKSKTHPEYFEPHDFLVKLRKSFFPVLFEVWDAHWLDQAPSGVVKSVVAGFLEVMGAENEDSSGTNPTTESLGFVTGGIRRTAPVSPDETRVQQLCDMGFPRSSVERALIRAHNNINGATEYLLSHPIPLAANAAERHTFVSVSQQREEGSQNGGDNQDAAVILGDSGPPNSSGADISMGGDGDADSAGTSSSSGQEVESSNQPPDETDYAAELRVLRDAAAPGIASKALSIIDRHPDLVFEVKRAFIGPSDKHQALAARKLLTDPGFFCPADASDVSSAARLRLIALVIGESRSSGFNLGSNDIDLLSQSLVKKFQALDKTDTAPSPTWLAPLLLVMENLLILGDEIQPIEVPKPEEAVPPAQLKVMTSNDEVRTILFDFCLRLLSTSSTDKNDLISCLRLLVLLTREHRLAVEFFGAGGLSKLLDRFRNPTDDTRGCQVHAIILIRHIIEDRMVLETIMKQDLTRWFTQPRMRTHDVWSFIRNNSYLALRDMTTFVEVCRSICALTSSSPTSSTFQISLKEDKKPKPSENPTFDPPVVPVAGDPQPLENPAEEGAVPPQSEPLDTLLKSLVSEVLRAGRATVTILSQPDSSASDNLVPQSNNEKPTKIDAEMSEFVYVCFLLQCLTELLSAYNICKGAFVSYSRKRSMLTKDASKQKSTILHFLLSDLLFFADTEASSTNADKRRVVLSNWAIATVVALCADPSLATTIKDIPPEVVAARKLVLEAIAKGFKETPPGELLESRYWRLGALAELTNKLLNFRPVSALTTKSLGESALHIPKLMLEKNFVVLLTATLGEIDLNYPNVRGLVAAMLRPLEYLTKTAIKMGRNTEKSKLPSSLLEPDESESSDFSVDEDEGEEGAGSDREETPDLYRNSALGMYGGEMEDMSYPNNDEEMDEDEEEADDLDMEYGDEEIGTDHTSETSEDEDAPEDIDVVSEDEDGEVWVEEEESAEEEDDEGDESHELEADEMMWEEDEADDMEDDPLGDAHDHLENANELMQVQGVDEEVDEEDDDEEAEIENGQELVALDVGVPSGGNEGSIWHFADGPLEPQLPLGMLVDGANPHARRNRLVDIDQFMQMQRGSRTRHGGSPILDPSTHPLLAETVNRGTGQSSVPHPPRAPHSRRLLRARDLLGDPGEVAHGFLNMIHDLIGEDGYQMIEHIMARGGPSTDTVVELRAGNGQPISITHLTNHRGATRSTAQASLRPSDSRALEAARQVQEFVPVSTPQRWVDESKMTQWRNTTERLNALVNYVVVGLLPEARAKDVIRKQEEEENQKAAAAAREAEIEAEIEAKQAGSGGESTDHQEPDSSLPSTLDEPSGPKQVTPSETVHMDTDGSMPSPDVDMDDVGELLPTAPPTTSSDVPAQSDLTERSARASDQPGATSSPNDGERTDGDAETSASPNRVTVLVNGNPVDITDTGIDPTFLEALPDDMREDVINQHLRERRAAQPIVRPAESQISPEFLDALPPDIRAEILQQEQEGIDRAQRERERTEGANNVPAGPSDIDSASFLASLDPQLRETVLMEQDDTFLQTLPSSLLAEASALLNGARAPRQASWRVRTTGAPTGNAPQPPKKPVVQRDAIQLLDKPDVATLIRLLFFPQVLRRNSLHKILVNLCENTKTRTDIFSLLLSILQDDPSDVVAVDRSFAQLSFRSSKPGPSSKTPTKPKSAELATSSIPPQYPAENIPNLITHRSLEALTYIVTTNEHATQYFLSEQETPPSVKRSSSKKGKGKEKQMPQAQFPLNLVLSLLDRRALLQSPPMMSAVALLLANVTKPLAILKDPTSSPEDSTENKRVPNASNGANPSESDGATDAAAAERPSPVTSNADDFSQKLRSDPPRIPPFSLRLIPNFLTAGECSGRTFQLALSLMQHVSYLPDVRFIIADELKLRAEDLGKTLQSDLEELVHALDQVSDSEEVSSSILSRFSPASADQAKLLRVLKTIDFMFSPRSSSSAPSDPSDAQEEAGKQREAYKIYEGFNFAPLWEKLGDALSMVQSKPNLDHIATVMLPLIESLMVVCKHVGTKILASNPAASPLSPRHISAPLDSAEDLFVSFTDAHRKVLNVMVRNNPSLMSGSFSLLVNNPKVLDFDNKRNYFNQQLHRRTGPREHHTTLQLNVRRPHVFEDSYQYLHRKTGDQIKYGKLNVRFYNEEGVDAGGVTREWFQILARQMFNPNYALFQPCAGDKLTYQPNRASAINPEHLLFFKFVGRIIGKAIYDGRLLDAYFARSLYRQILGKPVDYRDVEWVDPEYYNSLCWILENDPTLLEMNFTVEAEEFGVRKMIELKEGGAGIPITQENKREFVQLSAQYRLYLSIKDQIESLLSGFYEIIPKELISIFNEQEVELLISGTPDIDTDEWRAATDYHGYTQSDPAIQWWWRALKSFNREERAKLLSFATGTSRVPLGGFGELQGVQGVQKFSIHRAYGEPDRLPQAHTCFNQIDLPEYSSYEKLRTQLLIAINEGGEGFGFA